MHQRSLNKQQPASPRTRGSQFGTPVSPSKERERCKAHGLLAAGAVSTGITVPCFPHLQSGFSLTNYPTGLSGVEMTQALGSMLQAGSTTAVARLFYTYVCVDRYTHAGDTGKVLKESPGLYNVSSDKGLFWKRKVPFLLYVR